MLIDDYKISILGYLLAEGNFCHPSGFYFYSNSEQEVKDYCKSLLMFENTEGKVDYSKSAMQFMRSEKT